ncbi:hypothetical protein, partial [Actinomadura geliboluensis]|uniref:hypothetical protein n=1 Tax=Actinomadura geliboluensis TaxID=882440 RepID=UPI00197ACFE4
MYGLQGGGVVEGMALVVHHVEDVHGLCAVGVDLGGADVQVAGAQRLADPPQLEMAVLDAEQVVTCSWIVTPGQSRFGDSECVCWGSWGRSGALTLPRFECGQM